MWGLEMEVQKRLRLHKANNAAEFYRMSKEVKDELGDRAVTVTMYGGKFNATLGKDLRTMQRIWSG